jgi:hypothetical protein
MTPRKPRALRSRGRHSSDCDNVDAWVRVPIPEHHRHTPRELRRAARWLRRVADWWEALADRFEVEAREEVGK